MRTVLALVAATAMIVGALYVRGELDGLGSAVGPFRNSDPSAVVCVSELRPVCDELSDQGVQVTIEEAGVTAARLMGDKPLDADAWLTIAPWDRIVTEARQRAGRSGLPAGDGAVYGRSPLVAAMWIERAAVLERHCKGAITWRCIAKSAGQPWGDLGGDARWGQLRPGYRDPAQSATGLLVLGQIASDLLGSTTFSARDLDDDTFLRLLTDLEDAASDHGTASNTPLQQQMQFGPGKFDIVGTIEAEAGPALARSAQRQGDLQLRHSETVVVAEVVLAPLRAGINTDRLRSLVEEFGSAALARAGWRVEGQTTAAGVPTQPTLPPKSNLPSAGVLDALRVRWGEIAR